jgi:hypothetical protein
MYRYRADWKGWLYEFDVKLGMLTFRDTTRLSEHLRGRYFLSNARLQSYRPDHSGEGSRSYKLGYRRLGRIASAERMREIGVQLERAFNSDDPGVHRVEKDGRIVHIGILPVEKIVPEIMSLLTDDILAAVRQYYRSNFTLYLVSAWRNYHVSMTPKEEYLSNHWHTDASRIDSLKVFVVASDVNEDDGPTHVLDREWTREVIRRGFHHRSDYRLPIEKIENPLHLVKLTGPAGTALLANTNLCLHRAGVPAPGRKRDIIEFRFIATPRMRLDPPSSRELAPRDRVTLN